MHEDEFKPFNFDDIRKLKSEAEWQDLIAKPAPQVASSPDWTRADLSAAEPKKMISLRVDPDVLDYFKSEGPGYQTRMNAVLRAWMEAQIKR
jgi:uncharacterized protein (DUF4415 family)